MELNQAGSRAGIESGSGRSSSVYLPRIVAGLFFLTLGTLFVLDNMGTIEFWDLGRFWPVFVIAFGLARMAQGRGRTFGLIVTLFGAWALLDTLDILEFDWHYFWPGVLVLMGLGMLWRGFRGGGPLAGAGVGRAGSGDDPSAAISALAILGGVQRRSTAQSFRGGDLTAILGGCDLDLRQAAPAPEGAVLDAFAVWGGIDIKVPPDWTVVIQGFPFLGGLVDSRTGAQPDPAKRLILRGTAIMGGIEVKS
jgi:hypothetical protein